MTLCTIYWHCALSRSLIKVNYPNFEFYNYNGDLFVGAPDDTSIQSSYLSIIIFSIERFFIYRGLC